VQNSLLGPLGKRIVAYVVLFAAAILALKIIAAVFFGLVQALFLIVLVIAAIFAVLWALRHI
jgi:hypothetical protein